MSDDKKKRIFRFQPNLKVPFEGKFYRPTNADGEPDYLESEIPIAPNHHFTPVGEYVEVKGSVFIKPCIELLEVQEKLEDIEAELLSKDPRKAKTFQDEIYRKVLKKKINDPKEVLNLLNPKGGENK